MREMDDHTRNYHLHLLRLEEREKSNRHKAFMDQWNDKGYEINRKNLTIRKENQKVYDTIKNYRQVQEETKKENKLTQSIKDQTDGIDSFEHILQKYKEEKDKLKAAQEEVVDAKDAKKDAKGAAKGPAKGDTAGQAVDEKFKILNELPKYN